MKVAFAGTPDFARAALAQLHAAGFEIPLVLTQPDRPAGRGLHLQASPVKAWAVEHGIPVAQPRSLRLDGKFAERRRSGARRAAGRRVPDVLVVAAYGLMLPRVGARAAAPRLHQHSCLAAAALARRRADPPGDRGRRCRRPASRSCRWTRASTPARCCWPKRCRSGADDTHRDLAGPPGGARRRADRRACWAIWREGGPVRPAPQPDDGRDLRPQGREGRGGDRLGVCRRRRSSGACAPSIRFPGATATLRRRSRQVLARAGRRPAPEAPGEVLAVGDEAIRVACGADVLELTQLQRAGGRRLSAREFLQRTPAAPSESEFRVRRFELSGRRPHLRRGEATGSALAIKEGMQCSTC